MASTNDEADIDDTTTTGDPTIDGLLTEYHWSFFARAGFQFTIPDSPSDYEDTRDLLVDSYPDDNHEGVVTMPAFMVDGIRKAIAEYVRILNFAITEQADNNVDTQLRFALADLTHDGTQPPPPAYAYTPQDDGVGLETSNWMSGDSFFNINNFSTRDMVNVPGMGVVPFTEIIGTYQYHTILHETGHALGLKHGHEATDDNPALPAASDSMEFSVMTYRGYVGDVIAGGYEVTNGDYAQTLMMLDIRALQHIYGADFTTESGDTVYRWDTQGAYLVNGVQRWNTDTNCIFLTIWDGGGTDTYDFSAFTTNETIDLTPGKWSNLGTQVARLGAGNMARGNVFNALQFNNDHRSIIENATGGTGNDTITGNFGHNRLIAGNGADRLFGVVGNDTLDAGAGADQLLGDTGDDMLTGGGADDLINGGAGFDTSLYVSVAGEVITITPTGNPSAGTWTVDGPAQAAGDVLSGIEAFGFGSGNDQITVVNAPSANLITIDAAGGSDTITGSNGVHDSETFIGGTGSDRIVTMAGRFTAYGGSKGAAPGAWNESITDNDLLVLDRSGFGADYTWGAVLFGTASPLGSFQGTDASTARGFARLDYTGSAFKDRIGGHLGGDTIRGAGGDDTLGGFVGDDLLQGGVGTNQLFGQDGNDTLEGGSGLDLLNGGEGNDRIVTGGGADFQVYGEAGHDTILGNAGNEQLHGMIGNDSIAAADGNDTVYGDAHLEVGNDTIRGGVGDDLFFLGLGVESLDGGDGFDRLNINRSTMTAGVSFFLNGAAGSDGTRAINFEGMAYNAGSGNDFVRGGAGVDGIAGNNGNDTLEGGDGADALSGLGGDDIVRGGAGLDDLRGGDGNDYIDAGEDGAAQLFGEAGNDTIIGSILGEVIFSHSGDDSVQGLGGADNIIGDLGQDTLNGGEGNDTIDPGLGVEKLDGGTGSDLLRIDRQAMTVGTSFYLNGPNGSDGTSTIRFEVLSYSAGAGNDTVRGAANGDAIAGNGGHDLIEGGGGADALGGGAGNDTIKGGAGTDILDGGDGNDRIETNGGAGTTYGRAGNDTLIGAADAEVLWGHEGDDLLQALGGNDNLQGNQGNDTLDGGTGNDTLTGDVGADRFLFKTPLNGTTNVDLIFGFAAAEDEIALDNAVFAGLPVGALAAASFRIGAAAADANDRIIFNAATGALIFDGNGNGAGQATQFATITGLVGTISAGNFEVV